MKLGNSGDGKTPKAFSRISSSLIAALGDSTEEEILRLVAAYDDFEGEFPDPLHQSGEIDHPAGKVIWFIAVYADDSIMGPSLAPHDPKKSYRSLMVSFVSELGG